MLTKRNVWLWLLFCASLLLCVGISSPAVAFCPRQCSQQGQLVPCDQHCTQFEECIGTPCPDCETECCDRWPDYHPDGSFNQCLCRCPAECPCATCQCSWCAGNDQNQTGFYAVYCQGQDPTFVRSDPRDLRGLREARQKAAARLLAMAR